MDLWRPGPEGHTIAGSCLSQAGGKSWEAGSTRACCSECPPRTAGSLTHQDLQRPWWSDILRYQFYNQKKKSPSHISRENKAFLIQSENLSFSSPPPILSPTFLGIGTCESHQSSDRAEKKAKCEPFEKEDKARGVTGTAPHALGTTDLCNKDLKCHLERADRSHLPLEHAECVQVEQPEMQHK